MSGKKLAVWAVVCGLALATTAWAEGPSGRIVTVDLNRLFNEFYKTPIELKKLQELRESNSNEESTMLTEYRKLNDELVKLRDESEKPEYTAEVKEQKRKVMTDKLDQIKKSQQDIEEFRRTRLKAMEEQRALRLNNILKDISDTIGKIATGAGYMMVLDKSGMTGNGMPSILFSQTGMDVTDDVLKVLNKNAPKTQP
jgi:Skp family chaperone for outer membrane proteins